MLGYSRELWVTISQDINDLITSRRPAALCDKCVAKALGLTYSAHPSLIAGTLATTSDFTREKAQCSACGKPKLVIHANRT